jgi:hypothetical protein
MRIAGALLSAALAAVLCAQEGSFLDAFFHREAGPKITAESVAVGYLARPATGLRFPAVLLLPSGGLNEKTHQWTRDLAGIGFAALATGEDAETAARWLTEQTFVDSQRMAGVAWAGHIPAALHLARTGKWKAVVLWGGTAPTSFRIPVLAVSATQDPEQAWVDVYKFLDGHVEDAPAQFARVVDLMRVLNSNAGLRGQLAASLLKPPATAEQWDQIRSRAAVLAETANLLLTRRPLKADAEGWKQRATDYRDAAGALFQAVEHKDYPSTQQCLADLTRTCAACHAAYR